MHHLRRDCNMQAVRTGDEQVESGKNEVVVIRRLHNSSKELVRIPIALRYVLWNGPVTGENRVFLRPFVKKLEQFENRGEKRCFLP